MRHYILPGGWPPNSPDLSPVENIAAAVNPVPAELQTLTALESRLRKSWRAISLTTLQNLIGSMHDILKAVIRNKGDTVPY